MGSICWVNLTTFEIDPLQGYLQILLYEDAGSMLQLHSQHRWLWRTPWLVNNSQQFDLISKMQVSGSEKVLKKCTCSTAGSNLSASRISTLSSNRSFWSFTNSSRLCFKTDNCELRLTEIFCEGYRFWKRPKQGRKTHDISFMN